MAESPFVVDTPPRTTPDPSYGTSYFEPEDPNDCDGCGPACGCEENDAAGPEEEDAHGHDTISSQPEIPEPSHTDKGIILGRGGAEGAVTERVGNEVESSMEAKIEARIEASIEARIKSEIESRIEFRIKSRIEARIEARIEDRIEARIEASIEARIQARIEAGIEASIEARIKSKIESRIEGRIEASIKKLLGLVEFEPTTKPRLISGDPLGPKRVHFEPIGVQALPTASPQSSNLMAHRISSPDVPDDPVNPGSILGDDVEDQPPPRKISSSRTAPEEDTVWASVNSSPDVIIVEQENLEPISPERSSSVKNRKSAPMSTSTNRPLKRKQQDYSGPVPRPRKQKKGQQVNLHVIQLIWTTEGQNLEYKWDSKEQCWVTDCDDDDIRKVDGEFLLAYSQDLAIQVRPNATWLPVVLRWAEKKNVFEGHDILDNDERFEVKSNVMYGMLCDRKQAQRGEGTFTSSSQ
ncbi:Fc.00g056410.m01.CDS01 [Cosmosporella sp. VM-42]